MNVAELILEPSIQTAKSIIGEFPSRGMVILKMDFLHSRFLLTNDIKKLADLPDFKNKTSVKGDIVYTIVAHWTDDIPFTIGDSVMLDQNGFITDYNAYLTERLIGEKVNLIRETETNLRKAGLDVNKELPSHVELTTYVITEAFNIKATKKQTLEDLITTVKSIQL